MTGLGERLFRAGLRALPRGLRESWQDELVDTFLRRQGEFRDRRGPALLPLLWLRELAALVLAAIRARRPDAWTRRTRPERPAAPGPDPTPDPAFVMEQFLTDLRFGLRAFLRNPGMMGLAAFSLALGIGASTAMFSVVDSVLLRPLPFEDPDELVNVYLRNPSMEGHPTLGGAALRGVFAPPEYWWLEENEDVFESVGAFYSWGGATLSGEGRPERIRMVRATPGLLGTLGVQAVRGRLLGPEDDPRDGGRSAMLTASFWASRFGEDPDVVGSEIRLDDEPFTVVGILPDRVEEATASTDLWILFSGSSADGNWGNHSVSGVVARLAEGVTPERAQAELDRVVTDVSPENDHGHLASVYPALDDNTRNVRPALLVLIAGAFVLLAVGCGNVASILIGAGIDREREIAVRSSLGARRGRLIRQLLTESMALALVGAVGGVALAALVGQGLLLLAPPDLPRIGGIALDGRVLAFAVGVSVAAGMLFGLVPALGLSRPDLSAAINAAASRGSSAGHGRVQSAVVVGELALATVLLVSGALLARTLFALGGVDLGVRAEGLYAVTMAPPYQRFDQEDRAERREAVDGYFQSLADAAAAVPGVSRVAVSSHVPNLGPRSNNDVTPEGWDAEAEGERLIAERRFVSEGYFETAGIRLVEGRGFEAAENRQEAAPVMVISEGLARRVWPDEPAVGKQVSFWGRDPATVVGVAADLRDERLDQATTYAFYVPARQVNAQTGSLLVRLEGDPATTLPAIRERLWEVDPDLPITRIASIEELVSLRLTEERYRARLMIAFAVLAALFAMTGVYGVTARSVARRTRELGIRVALGAERSQVLGLIVRQGVRLAVFGVVLGLVLSWFTTGLLEDMLYGVRRGDPLSLVVIALLVGGTSILASLPPGRRATRVDPMDALRAE